MVVDRRPAPIDGLRMIRPRLTAAAVLVAAILTAGGALGAPDDDLLPKGAAKAMILRACTTCHGTFDIVHAYGKTTEQWRGTLVRMETHGGQFTAEEVQAISTYLGKNFGPGPAAAPAAVLPEPAPTPAPAPAPSPATAPPA
jgi:hypothetical protein